jgi:hypothetical protein
MQKSSYGERRKLRAEAMLELNGASPKSKSARAFLRRRIPELWEEKRDQKRAAERKATEDETRASFPVTEEPAQETTPKVYSGYPRDDNPQTRERQATFENRLSRDKLRKTPSSVLMEMLSEMQKGDLGASLTYDERETIRYLLSIPPEKMSYHNRNKATKLLIGKSRQEGSGV